ncbi:MAG: hypothetical protein ACRDGA_04170 [Bacteroidota bacterium]
MNQSIEKIIRATKRAGTLNAKHELGANGKENAGRVESNDTREERVSAR